MLKTFLLLLQDIAIGSFSVCKRCIHKANGGEFAVKVNIQTQLLTKYRIFQPAGVAEWTARPLDMREVLGLGTSPARVDSKDALCTSNIERRWWCIHPGLKTHAQSQLKAKTESTSGSTKWWQCTKSFVKKYPSNLAPLPSHGELR